MNIGDNVRRIRTERNMTQIELAERVGVSQSMINQIERGTKALNVNLAAQMAVVLECEVNDFAS